MEGNDNCVPQQEVRTLGRNLQGESNDKNPIEITEVLNGFFVRVGCRQVVFETRERLLSELERYLKNRKSVEKEYMEKCK